MNQSKQEILQLTFLESQTEQEKKKHKILAVLEHQSFLLEARLKIIELKMYLAQCDRLLDFLTGIEY